MLTTKMMKTVENLSSLLLNNGWLGCDSSNTILKKSHTYLIFDEQPALRDKIEYTEKQVEQIKSGDIASGVQVMTLLDKMEKYTWHTECDGVVTSFGKIPSVFSNRYERLEAASKKEADSFLQLLEDVVTYEHLRVSQHATYVDTEERPELYTYMQKINSLDEALDTVIWTKEGSDKCFCVRQDKTGSNVILAQAILDTSKPVYSVSIAKGTQPIILPLEKFYSKMNENGAALYELSELSKQVTYYKWKENKLDVFSTEQNIQNLLPIEIDKIQLYYLNKALHTKMDLSRMLTSNLDGTTLKWVLKMLERGYDCSAITCSMNDKALEYLFSIASRGCNIAPYIHTGATEESIREEYSRTSAKLSELVNNLLAQGYSQEAADFIAAVSTYDRGITHVAYKEPLIKLQLRNYAIDFSDAVLSDYLINNGEIYNAVICCNENTLNESIKARLQEYLSDLANIDVKGVPFGELAKIDEVKGLVFTEGNGIGVITSAGYVYRDSHSIMLTVNNMDAVCRIMKLNGQLVVI